MKLCTLLPALKFKDEDYAKVQTLATTKGSYCVKPDYTVQEKASYRQKKTFQHFLSTHNESSVLNSTTILALICCLLELF